MNWSDIASSQLPTLSTTSIFPVHREDVNPTSNRSKTDVSSSLPLQSNSSWNVNPPSDALTTRPSVLEDDQHRDCDMADAKFETFEDMLTRHENEIVNSVLTDSAWNTRRNVDNMIEKKIQAAWERDREIWIQDVIGTRHLGGAGSRGNEPNLVLRQSVQQSQSERQLVNYQDSNDMDLVRVHLDIIKRFMPAVRNRRDSDIRATIDQLSLFVRSHFRERSYDVSSRQAYISSLQLASELVSLASHSGPADQARACLSYLCKQFREFIKGVVSNIQDSAPIQVSPVYKSGLANQCHIFASHQLGTGASEDQLFWATLFYCLRSGDAVAALEVLHTNQTLIINHGAPIANVVRTMAHAQDPSDCFWSVPFPSFSSDDLVAIDNLCTNARSTDLNQIYQVGVYTLLARTGKPKTSADVYGFKTIEDYLTSCLFSVMLQAKPVDELIRIGKQISYDFGLEYFHDSNSGGWSFAIPLLLTQQYKRALAHLAEKGGPIGLLFASHLGLILGCSGIPARDLVARVDEMGDDDDIVPSLMVDYANYLLSDLNFGSVAAFEYLVRIPYTPRALNELSRLITITSDVGQVAGTLDAEGKRQHSVLDQYLNPNEVIQVLSDAADILVAGKYDLKKNGSAVMCFMLAGRFGDVLSIFNKLLSPPNVIDHDKEFWIEQVEQFHRIFLSSRTHVLDTLNRTGRSKLIQTNRLLLEMNRFEKLLSTQKLAEAWQVANDLGIIPMAESEMSTKVSLFNEMDDVLKHAIPTFMSGYVDILKKRISQTKREMHGDNSEVTRSLLRKMEEQGRLIITFAASTGAPSEQIKNLSSLLQL